MRRRDLTSEARALLPELRAAWGPSLENISIRTVRAILEDLEGPGPPDTDPAARLAVAWLCRERIERWERGPVVET